MTLHFSYRFAKIQRKGTRASSTDYGRPPSQVSAFFRVSLGFFVVSVFQTVRLTVEDQGHFIN